MAGKAWRGAARSGMVRQAGQGTVSRIKAWRGLAGKARLGAAIRGVVRLGNFSLTILGPARNPRAPSGWKPEDSFQDRAFMAQARTLPAINFGVRAFLFPGETATYHTASRIRSNGLTRPGKAQGTRLTEMKRGNSL